MAKHRVYFNSEYWVTIPKKNEKKIVQAIKAIYGDGTLDDTIEFIILEHRKGISIGKNYGVKIKEVFTDEFEISEY